MQNYSPEIIFADIDFTILILGDKIMSGKIDKYIFLWINPGTDRHKNICINIF